MSPASGRAHPDSRSSSAGGTGRAPAARCKTFVPEHATPKPSSRPRIGPQTSAAGTHHRPDAVPVLRHWALRRADRNQPRRPASRALTPPAWEELATRRASRGQELAADTSVRRAILRLSSARRQRRRPRPQGEVAVVGLPARAARRDLVGERLGGRRHLQLGGVEASIGCVWLAVIVTKHEYRHLASGCRRARARLS